MNETRELAVAQDWNRPDWPKLWLYNLHYFDDLVAVDAEGREAWHAGLVERWVTDNPPATGNGWAPYPTSLRIVNWIKWEWTGEGRLSLRARHSLAVQARWLAKRLEYHLLGNHLWANAKALVFAGMFFAGEEAGRWLHRGLGLIRRELAEQVLADGGHFERSPMYHAIVLEDLLDLMQLARHCPGTVAEAERSRWQATASRMLGWLEAMSHPDGGIAFFNDAAHGIAPDLAALTEYAMGQGVAMPARAAADRVSLAESGYERLRCGEAELIADVGPIGPDYLPGHAHADTLSFELSVAGRRRLVNSGTSTYAVGAERLRQRGTAAHNTVVVDGQDSSEVWSSFRVARRARVGPVEVHPSGEGLNLVASHDGYRRLPGRVMHHRCWQLEPCALEVTDRLEGQFTTAEARYHFAPGERLRWTLEGGEGQVMASTWHPEFGKSVPNEVLVIRFRSPVCRVRFEWS